PVHGFQELLKCRKLECERAIAVQSKRCTVEHQLILPAHLVYIEDRQVAFRYTCDRDIEPHGLLVAPIRRAIRHEQQFCPGLAQALNDIGSPDILTNRNAEANSTKTDWARQRTRGEDALFIKDAIVRQIDF